VFLFLFLFLFLKKHVVHHKCASIILSFLIVKRLKVVKYIEVVVDHKKAKRVTSVRVSKIYLDALNRAEPELLQEFGYKFSVSKILEMALDSALEEIKLETGYAFYEIEQFKIDMEGLIKRLGLDKITTVDVDGVIQNIFSEYSELRLRKLNSDSEITDMVSIIEKKKQS